jgi:hypothetical protein
MPSLRATRPAVAGLRGLACAETISSYHSMHDLEATDYATAVTPGPVLDPT